MEQDTPLEPRLQWPVRNRPSTVSLVPFPRLPSLPPVLQVGSRGLQNGSTSLCRTHQSPASPRRPPPSSRACYPNLRVGLLRATLESS